MQHQRSLEAGLITSRRVTTKGPAGAGTGDGRRVAGVAQVYHADAEVGVGGEAGEDGLGVDGVGRIGGCEVGHQQEGLSPHPVVVVLQLPESTLQAQLDQLHAQRLALSRVACCVR